MKSFHTSANSSTATATSAGRYVRCTVASTALCRAGPCRASDTNTGGADANADRSSSTANGRPAAACTRPMRSASRPTPPRRSHPAAERRTSAPASPPAQRRQTSPHVPATAAAHPTRPDRPSVRRSPAARPLQHQQIEHGRQQSPEQPDIRSSGERREPKPRQATTNPADRPRAASAAQWRRAPPPEGSTPGSTAKPTVHPIRRTRLLGFGRPSDGSGGTTVTGIAHRRRRSPRTPITATAATIANSTTPSAAVRPGRRQSSSHATSSARAHPQTRCIGPGTTISTRSKTRTAAITRVSVTTPVIGRSSGSSNAISRRHPVTPSAAIVRLTSSGMASRPARNNETTYPSQVQPKADTSTSQNRPGPSHTGLDPNSRRPDRSHGAALRCRVEDQPERRAGHQHRHRERDHQCGLQERRQPGQPITQQGQEEPDHHQSEARPRPRARLLPTARNAPGSPITAKLPSPKTVRRPERRDHRHSDGYQQQTAQQQRRQPQQIRPGRSARLARYRAATHLPADDLERQAVALQAHQPSTFRSSVIAASTASGTTSLPRSPIRIRKSVSTRHNPLMSPSRPSRSDRSNCNDARRARVSCSASRVSSGE